MAPPFPFLTALVLVPAGVGLLVLLIPRQFRAVIRGIAVVTTIAVLGIAVMSLDEFKAGDGGYQLVSQHTWVSSLGINWTLGIDGVSLFLVLMTAVLFVLAVLGASERTNLKAFMAWVLLLEAGCLGSFVSLDVLLFYLFFETTLVPVYFLISGWGHERRSYAATKFFVYTFVASVFMLVGIIALVFLHDSQSGVVSFDVRALASTHLSNVAGILLFLSFTIAFVVKAPVWPFHTWSPDAYAEAPAAGSVLLVGVMAKLGTYGIIRFDLGLFPHATVVLAPVLLSLGVAGIIYGGIAAAVQRDLKRLVAYSSLAHMGFIVLGAFALSGEALTGAVLQMVNHGLVTAALFLLIAMISARRGSFEIAKLRGIQHSAPVLAGIFTIVMLASIGVPGLNGFVGEFLILAGTFLTHRWWTVVAMLGVVLAAVYLLWGYQQVFHGSSSEEEAITGHFREISWKESLVVAPLVVLIVFLGIYPKPVLSRITPSVNAIVSHVVHAGQQKVPASGLQSATGRSR